MNTVTKSWDAASKEPQKEKERGYYLTHLFLTAIKKSLKYIPEKKLPILKVDLWNEGVDHERNILKHLSSHTLFGLDLAYSTCTLAKKFEPEVMITNGSIETLPYHDASFSLLLDLSTSDHVPPEKLDAVCNEYGRVVKRDGAIVLIFDRWGLVWKAYMWYLEKIRGHDDSFFENTKIPSRYFHSIKQYKQALKAAGFIIEKEYSLDYTGWTWNRITYPIWKRMPNQVYDFLLKIEYSLASKYLRSLAKQYVIIARKNKNKNNLKPGVSTL